MKKNRLFLIVEGNNDGYPNYDSATLHFSENDPCTLSFDNLFVCSPVFSLKADGYDQIPDLKDDTKLVFIMCPNIFPTFGKLLAEFNFIDEAWFSLGLANLIIIENNNNKGIANKVVEFLSKKSNITAWESWTLKHFKIYHDPKNSILNEAKKAFHYPISFSDKLPLHLKFTVSEYILSINKFLTASRKFTPHYFEQHKKTIDASVQLVSDLSFLYDDDTLPPSATLLESLGVSSHEQARAALNELAGKNKKENLINDRSGKLIQFNSSMSYIYSQAYSGTFPIFDHFGIVRRHSLLGLGTAIGSLFELLSQIEESLFFLPFENVSYSIYSNPIPSHDYYNFLQEPSNHEVSLWINDSLRKNIIENSDPTKFACHLPETYFNRLSFYSGRLGFREYDLSATAAMQVIVEATSLQWNVINYTHEIIHNHVRIILGNLILPAPLLRMQNDDGFLKEYSVYLKETYQNPSTVNLNYKQYFIITLIHFGLLSRFHGSLTKESNFDKINKQRTDPGTKKTFALPAPSNLRNIILAVYKDITEIFVHTIDYSYIYNKNLQVYIQSIWASWSTVISVSTDLKQYVLRTLLVISHSVDGTSENRWNRSRLIFKGFLNDIKLQNNDAFIFDRIEQMLNDEDDDDLRFRFFACLIVSDLSYQFFIGRLENKLDNNDQNRLIQSASSSNENILYNIERNSFQGDPITSKVRFALDQLLRTASNKHDMPDCAAEKESAWLLLSLSSFNTTL